MLEITFPLHFIISALKHPLPIIRFKRMCAVEAKYLEIFITVKNTLIHIEHCPIQCVAFVVFNEHVILKKRSKIIDNNY